MSSQDDWLVDPKSNRFIDTYMRGYLDMSGGHLILRNNNIHVNDGDISLNGRLFDKQTFFWCVSRRLIKQDSLGKGQVKTCSNRQPSQNKRTHSAGDPFDFVRKS